MNSLLSAVIAGTFTISSIAAGSTAGHIKPSARIQQKASAKTVIAKSVKSLPVVSKKLEDSTNPPVGKVSPVKKKYLKVCYAHQNTAYQIMNIYIPKKGVKPFPVIAYIHGGGFRSSPNTAPINKNILNAAVGSGYAVASINYRGSAQAKFPAAVDDCKTAIRFLKANAVKYDLNPKKIAAWGESAGGNLAAMLGTTGSISSLSDNYFENPNYSSTVQAVIDWFGPIDFLTEDQQFEQLGITSVNGLIDSETSNASQYIGEQISKDPEFTEFSNPCYYLSSMSSKIAPSFFIEHGMSDRTVPVLQSVDFYNNLVNKIGADKVRLKLIDNAMHGSPIFYKKNNLTEVMDFLNSIFKTKNINEQPYNKK